jgi:hypothetical protein
MDEKREQQREHPLPDSPSLDSRDSPGEKEAGVTDWQGYDPAILSTVLDD